MNKLVFSYFLGGKSDSKVESLTYGCSKSALELEDQLYLEIDEMDEILAWARIWT